MVMLDVFTPRRLTIIIFLLITFCTIFAIIEEWFLENRRYFQSLSLFGLFGGLSGLATKYRQYQSTCQLNSRIGKHSPLDSRASLDFDSDTSDQHALIDMDHTH